MAAITRIISATLLAAPLRLVIVAGLLAAGSLYVQGCAPKGDLVGTWVGHRDLLVPPGHDPHVVRSIARVELRLHANGEFELFEGGVPKTGKYRVSGNTAYLKVLTFFDRPIEELGKAAIEANQEIEASLQRDGSLRFWDPKGYEKLPVILRRETQP